MSAAELVVSNDSGLMHVAAALGRPLVALYGSSDSRHTPPLTHVEESSRAVTRIAEIQGLDCRPCFRRECPLGHFRCMNELDPQRVLQEVRVCMSKDLRFRDCAEIDRRACTRDKLLMPPTRG